MIDDTRVHIEHPSPKSPFWTGWTVAFTLTTIYAKGFAGSVNISLGRRILPWQGSAGSNGPCQDDLRVCGGVN